MARRPEGGKNREGAAPSVEETDPTVEQSERGHGLGRPGGVPLPAAAGEGTARAGHRDFAFKKKKRKERKQA